MFIGNYRRNKTSDGKISMEKDKRQISIEKINKDKDYIIKNQLKGRKLVYVFEEVEEIALDIKKILLQYGFLPSNYKNKEEMFASAKRIPPEVFFVSTIRKTNYDVIRDLKNDKYLSLIFVIASSIYKNSSDLAYKSGADFYIPMPYVWKRLPYLIRALTFINDLRYSEENPIKNDMEIDFSGKGKTIVEIRF